MIQSAMLLFLYQVRNLKYLITLMIHIGMCDHWRQERKGTSPAAILNIHNSESYCCNTFVVPQPLISFGYIEPHHYTLMLSKVNSEGNNSILSNFYYE